MAWRITLAASSPTDDGVTDPASEEKYQALKRYARDLTELARRGKLDPVIGRDDEKRQTSSTAT